MKMVQTSWAGNNKDLLMFNAGWLSPEYHLMAWTLSCLQLHKYYENVVLHTDYVTAKMLVDVLQLPYSEVITDLDQFNDIPPELFGLPKIHVYSQQTTPFLHVDGDVFIWKSFDNDFLKSDLIAQNMEIGTSLYERAFKRLESSLQYFPSEIVEEKERNKRIYSYNAGIIGGNDLDFFNFYTRRAKEVVFKNSNCFSGIRPGIFNIYFEQFLFYCLSIKFKKKVSVLFDDIFADDGYLSLGGFIDVPYQKQYIHLIGRLKKSKLVCEEMANRLRQDYPENYYRIIALFKNKQIPLKTDYYHFIDLPNQLNLTDRYYKLKNRSQNYASISSENRTDSDSKLTLDVDLSIVNNLNFAYKEMESKNGSDKIYHQMLKDAEVFESQIKTILRNKFSHYSNECLYKRDISYTSYYEYLFADKSRSLENIVEADSKIELVKSKFDWSTFDIRDSGDNRLILNTVKAFSNVYYFVIPECHSKGYSLYKIDELDRKLLQFLKKSKTIGDLLEKMKSAFELSDLEESLDEFEMLVIGRIKLGLQAKVIKAVM